MSDGTEQSAPVQSEAAPQEATSTPDPIMSRLDELSSQIGSLMSTPKAQDTQGLSQSFTNGTEGAQEAPEAFPEGYGYEDPYQQGYEPQQPAYDENAVAQLQQYIGQQIQQGIQQHVTPMVAEQQAKELERKYPELSKDAGPTLQAAQQWAHRTGQPDLARDPRFIELVYLAQSAAQQAQQETPAGGNQEVQLEGGGATPDQPEPGLAERIVNAGPGGQSGFKWF